MHHIFLIRNNFAIKIVAACALFITACSTIHAQTADSKRALAVRAISAQEGPEMQRMFGQLVGSAQQPLIERWNDRILQLPASKQEAAIKALDAELKKFGDETMRIVTAEAAKVKNNTLITAYVEKFSEDELKQLVTMMEAPVFKKYQSVAPELGGVYVKAIVDGTRERVVQRSQAFDVTAEKIAGPAPAPTKKP